MHFKIRIPFQFINYRQRLFLWCILHSLFFLFGGFVFIVLLQVEEYGWLFIHHIFIGKHSGVTDGVDREKERNAFANEFKFENNSGLPCENRNL